MKLACYVMMRNESPMLGPFLDQLEAFFDYCVFVDHDSTDDSVEKVQSRSSLNYAMYHLKSLGYPQSPVATYFARNILSRQEFDALFFLDCDEFLPFSDKEALERFLLRHSNADVIRLNWVNCAPSSFDKGNIFAYPFERAKAPSSIPKIIIRSSLWKKTPDFSISQGYHAVTSARDMPISVSNAEEAFIIHLPIQSRTQIAIKLVNGHNRLMRERTNIARNQGYHWVEAAYDLKRSSFADASLRALALNYAGARDTDAPGTEPLDFDFPYVRSEYSESSRNVVAQIAGLIDADLEVRGSEDMELDRTSFSVFDAEGTPVLTSHSNVIVPAESELTDSTIRARPMLLALDTLGQDYTKVIEPLFSLPTQLPLTAWEGHIPFMFVLFKLLMPRTYVELGVHNGASFIAACTAAKSYNIRCQLFGIDTWEGDEHAGHYEGERILHELETHLDGTYPTARLLRSLFSEARTHFGVGSIDLLHIDGLHTYEAVREDFTTWFSTMSPSGVILFHDICVHERGFGVHRFWAELKDKFTTAEFHHSHGLGVLFLDPDHQALAPLRSIVRDENAMQLYRDLVEDIAATLRDRMGYLEGGHLPASPVERERELVALRAQLDAVYKSTSWRITNPVRALKRLIK